MPVGQIFQGVTTAPCRDYIAEEIIYQKPSIVYMPCAGRFGAAQAYINHGGDKKVLETSDICLFSSMLGYLFDDEKDVSDLGIVNESVIQPRNEDDIEIIAAAMLAIKYGQIKPNSLYGINIRKEMVRNASMYLDSMIDGLCSIKDKAQTSQIVSDI